MRSRQHAREELGRQEERALVALGPNSPSPALEPGRAMRCMAQQDTFVTVEIYTERTYSRRQTSSARLTSSSSPRSDPPAKSDVADLAREAEVALDAAAPEPALRLGLGLLEVAAVDRAGAHGVERAALLDGAEDALLDLRDARDERRAVRRRVVEE